MEKFNLSNGFFLLDCNGGMLQYDTGCCANDATGITNTADEQTTWGCPTQPVIACFCGRVNHSIASPLVYGNATDFLGANSVNASN